MSKKSIQTGDAPRVVINAFGALSVKGWEEVRVEARCENGENVQLEGDEAQVTLNSKSDCSLQVPENAQLVIEQANSDTVIKNVSGSITVKEAMGSLKVRNTGALKVERVRGDFSAKNIEGSLDLEEAYGNVAARNLEGSFDVDGDIKGNLSLEDFEGSAAVKALGNISVSLDPEPEQSYSFEAAGNILCRIPGDTDVKISITRATKYSIVLDSEGQEPVRDFGNGPYERTLGEGTASLVLQAHGNITVINPMSEWGMEDFGASIGAGVGRRAEDISQQVLQQVEAHMEALSAQLDAQMENLDATLNNAGLSEAEAQRIAQRAREASTRATERAQEKMRRTQERIQRKMESIQNKAEQRARAAERRAGREGRSGWGMNFQTSFPNSPVPPAPPVPPNEPVREDERLMILRMLAEKKITAEEADSLLAALEG